MRILKAWFKAAIVGGALYTLALCLQHYLEGWIAGGLVDFVTESLVTFIYSTVVVIYLLTPAILLGSILLWQLPRLFWTRLFFVVSVAGVVGYLVGSGNSKFFDGPYATSMLSGVLVISSALFVRWANSKNIIDQCSIG